MSWCSSHVPHKGRHDASTEPAVPKGASLDAYKLTAMVRALIYWHGACPLCCCVMRLPASASCRVTDPGFGGDRGHGASAALGRDIQRNADAHDRSRRMSHHRMGGADLSEPSVAAGTCTGAWHVLPGSGNSKRRPEASDRSREGWKVQTCTVKRLASNRDSWMRWGTSFITPFLDWNDLERSLKSRRAGWQDFITAVPDGIMTHFK